MIFDTYSSRLQDIDGLILPQQDDVSDVNWHLYPIRVKSEYRTRIFNELRGHGIGVQVNYIPAHWHPVFFELGHRRGDFPLSEQFYESEISLPMYPNLEIHQVHLIADKLVLIMEDCKNG